MARVKVTNYGMVRIEAGWYIQELELAPGTIEDVLLSLPVSVGKTLHDLLIAGGTVKPGYSLLYNGINVQDQEGLRTRVKDGDNIVAIDVLHVTAGG